MKDDLKKNRIEWSHQMDEWMQGRLTDEEQRTLLFQIGQEIGSWESLMFSHAIGQYFADENEKIKNNSNEELK